MRASLGLAGCAVLAMLPRASAGPERSDGEVREYRVATAWVVDQGTRARALVLRSFRRGGVPGLLVVDPQTLRTRLVLQESVGLDPVTWEGARAALADTPYGRAGRDALRNEDARQDAGLDHGSAGGGIDLTVDLCPSRHPLDRELFTALIDEVGVVERPVPVAVAVTGRWMRAHPQDLSWLAALDRSGRLAITWVNHSFNHFVGRKAPLTRSFLLAPGTNLEHEILDTEVALIECGLTPSVFFRFPGLVSSPRLVEAVVAHGLVPLGSDAWLAKGETPRAGSIVLVHANGNEPVGVRRFLALLRTERVAVREHRWLLLDLRESLEASDAVPGRSHGH